MEFYTNLDKKVTVEQVNNAMLEASNASFEYIEDPNVSSDVVGTSAGSIFDATQTEIMEHDGNQLVKTVAWYDSEYGFASNLVRLVEHFSEIAQKGVDE